MSGSNWFITGSNSANAAGSITPGSFIVLSQKMTSERLLDNATLKKLLSISPTIGDGSGVSVSRGQRQAFSPIYSGRLGLLVLDSLTFPKDGPHSPSKAPPSLPHLQSSQIRFNQTSCAVWLGVRKRIISKQSSYSPGFIGIRTGLLCRI